MKCPVCKKIIPDNALKCPYCKTRTGLLCKNCGEINTIFDLKCKNCGEEILKVCEHCNGINFPNAKKCRKCGIPFGQETVNEDTLEYRPVLTSQKNAITLLTQGLLSDDKKIFSISGEKGVGKSFVLKETAQKLNEYKFVWLFGKCTPLTQLTPGGLIQDMILNLYNLPNFCMNTVEFRKDATNFFRNEFPDMTGFEVNNFVNFLYSFQDGKFEDLLINKKKTYNILYKVFDKIISIGKLIIVADNFDFIDGFSYEFLNNLIKRENIIQNMKFIMMYCDYKPAKGYFYLGTDMENSYLDISIAPLNAEETNNMCKLLEDAFSYTNEFEKHEIIEKSKGHPAYLEQALSLCFDCQIGDKPFVLPNSFTEIINERLKNLNEVNPVAYRILVGASVLGNKINLALLKEIFSFDDKEFNGIIDYLREMHFIAPVNEIFYEFKNLLLWETILTSAKYDADFIDVNTRVANTLNNFILNSNAILGIIAQNLKQPELALNIWTKNTRLAAYIGDINLYVISQKQCLALINELDESKTLKVRYNISERLGKLLSDYNPKEALEFLPDAISNANAVGNTPKEIELLGYLSYCCLKTGNYYGCVECVDNVLSKATEENKLEIALLKTCKLEALLNIGNCGEVINTVDNDIIPVLDGYLAKPYKTKISYEFIYETWMKTYLILANALVLQGNDRAFEILTIIFDIIERNKIKDDLFICKTKLTLAFANTIKGDFYTSETILEDILKLYKTDIMDNETILRWNLIQILNNFFREKYKGMQEDLFRVVTFANNCGDNFTKNILKTLLGKIFKDNEQSKHALDIYNDQITYFAKEKMALGALLAWYLIADATLVAEGPHAAIEIASQALDVAQNPKINNYLFIILLKTVIAKASIVISDYETAKIHLENSIILAGKFNLKDILSRLYLLYGKYFQEIGLLKTDKQSDYLTGAGKMYEKASEIVKQTKNNCVHIEIEKAKNVLKSFCQLNSIKI